MNLNGFAKPGGLSSQEIWWRHTQALLANHQTKAARAALERAYDFLLEGITNLRDEGLRRNYLNKVRANRELLQFWIRDGRHRKLLRQRLFAHLAIESNPREPFKRLADTGLRLNALHDLTEIQAFLVEEATELSGGERVVLILEKAGQREVVESALPPGEDARKLLSSIDPHLLQVRLSRTTHLSVPKTTGLSRIIAPLIVQNQVTGYLYVDMHSIYGVFNETDRDMLGMLANQAAVALDNAHWAQGLEQKVEERTQELNDRVGELAILNTVGEAMAKTMDVKTVTRIVGDKVRDIFNAEGVSIMLLDPRTNMIHVLYEYDPGEGGYIDYIEPFPLGVGLTSRVIQTRKSLLLGTQQEQIAQGAYLPPESIENSSGITSESMLNVPIIVGDQVLGVAMVSSYESHAFSESDLRLLQTLSSNMGVSIQNARLFEAEQQRNTELQIINSIQQGLASKLDFQAIIELLGNKLLEIFKADVVGISQYDANTKMVSFPYVMDHGQRFYPETQTPGAAFLYQMRTRQPVLIQDWSTSELVKKLQPDNVGGPTQDQSHMFVPILSGDQMVGSIGIGKLPANAFNESDLRLLETLTNSMSVALENARLFDETQRLLKETEQRAVELSVINTVQAALAAEMNIQEIYDTVGDKIREIFNNVDLNIRIFDLNTKMQYVPYGYESGQRLHVEFAQ